MNVKAVPTSPNQRQSPSREEKEKRAKSKSAEKKDETVGDEITLEAADAAMRESQPTDSQAVAELLAHIPKAAPPAKFPTPRTPSAASATAKKLDRRA